MLVNLPVGAIPANVEMYRTEDRDTAATVLPLTSLGNGRWTADTTGLTSRWYPTVPYTYEATEYRQDLPYVDLPEIPDLIVSPEKLAKKARIPLPLSEDDRELIVECIRDAQADVIAHLGRQIMPTTFTENGRYDVGGNWDLTPLDEPVIDVLSAVPEMSNGQPTGGFTITYVAGLNAKDDPALSPIRRYVTAHAMNSPEFVQLWKTATKIKGDIKSVTTEGQSISYDKVSLGGGGKGQPGELPDKSSMDYWRLRGRRVFQRRTAHREPWPYTGYSGRTW